MKILILVLAVSSVAQCTILKTLARSSRGYSGSGPAPYGSSQFSVERAQEVGESEVFGNRAGPGNRYLPPGPPAQQTHNVPQVFPPAPSYIPPRSEAPLHTQPAPSFAHPPVSNYLPPQPAPAHNNGIFSAPPPPPASNYLPPQSAATHGSGAFASPPSSSYLAPQQTHNNVAFSAPPSSNYLPPQSAPSQGRDVFSPPPQPQNNYIPPPAPIYGPPQPQPSNNYIPPAATHQNFAAVPPSPNYLPPQPQPFPDTPVPNYIPPSPSYIPPANDFPSPSQPQPSSNYLPPQGAFDSQSGYSYQAPNNGFFRGQDNFEQAGAGFDVRQSDRASSDYLPPQEPHFPEPGPVQLEHATSEEAGSLTDEISGGHEESVEHTEEHAGPAEPVQEKVKTIKVISEPSHTPAEKSVKTIRVITERKPAPVHDDNVKVIRVIHENRGRSLGSSDVTKVLRVISDGGSGVSSVSSPSQVFRIINDHAPISSPAIDTSSKVVRIISDGASSASNAFSSGSASSVLRILSSGISAAPVSAVSELHTNTLAESPNKIFRIVSDSASGVGSDLYGSTQYGHGHTKILKVVSDGSSAISSPSTVLRVLGSSPSSYATNDIYSGYGSGSSALQTYRVLAKRNSVETPVSTGTRYADNSKVLRVVE